MSDIKLATEVIDLPSQGKVYPKDHPLSKGTVEIKYMTAREEDILASQNLIKKGVVLDKLFEAVVIEDGVNVDDIFIGDKNAILLATRILGYGADYKVAVTDPFTGEDQQVNINLATLKTKDVDFDELNGTNEYEYTLPKSKVKIKFKLLTHGDEKKINADLQALQRLAGKEGVSADISTRLRHTIVEVDGNHDSSVINQFVNNGLIAADSRELRKYIRTITPDMDFKFEFVSELTGEKEALDVPFGVEFFYPSE